VPVLVEDNLVSNDLSRTTDPTRVLVPIRYPVPAHVVRPIKSLTLSNAERGLQGRFANASVPIIVRREAAEGDHS